MSIKHFILILCLSLCAILATAQNPNGPPREQAKDLVERAKTEDNDRARQVQDYCTAADMEPKNKKYVDTCNNYKSGLNSDDTANLAIAIQAYKNHDLDKAETQAKLVTTYDQKLSGQARFLLDRIRNEKLLNQVKAAWDKGDFNSVVSLTQSMTNPDLKAAANVYVNDVNQYNGYINQAKGIQGSNPQEAIRQLTAAQNLNPNGPGNTASLIASLQKPTQVKVAPQLVPAAPKPALESPAEIAKKAAKLMTDARDAEKQGKLPDALNDYQLVLKLQPTNDEAQSSANRLEQQIKSDPAAARNELTSAIRYFYHSQLDDARRALLDYLESPQTAKNPGAADFYLGATLIERSILITPRAQWQGPSPEALSAFKEARKANYNPVRAYISPSLLKVWDSVTP
jgi:hypothetical protein